MELIQTIVLLCQVFHSAGGSTVNYTTYKEAKASQTECQQSYLNCVLKRNSMTKDVALQRCILEK